MNTVLIATENSEVNKLLTIVVDSNFECNIFETSSHQHAKDEIISNPKIGLILSDQSPLNGEIFNQVKKTGKDIPYFLFSNMTNDECPAGFLGINSPNRNIPIKFQKSVLTSELDKILPIRRNTCDDFFRVNISTFLDGHLKYTDTHLQLSSSKFVKITTKNDTESNEIIPRLIKRNVEFLWIQKDNYEQFIDTMMTDIFKKIEDPKTPLVEKIRLQIESIEKLHKCIQSLGITEQIISLTDTVIELAFVTANKDEELQALADLMKKNMSYPLIHSRLSAYIASTIVENISWSTEIIIKNLAMAAIFQNITLSEPIMASIQSLNDTRFDKLNRNEKQLIKTHMYDAIKLLDKLPRFSIEVQKLIQYHHELPESKGFPRGLRSMAIPQLSCIFILATQFAHELIMRGFDKNTINEIIDEFETRFDNGNFKKPLVAFIDKFRNL